MGKTMGRLRVGCAGFSNKAWVGDALPKATRTDGPSMLDAYQELFDFVEVNSTFYHCPSAHQIQTWKQRCAPGFEMGLKVTQSVTHDGHLTDPKALEALRNFVTNAKGLGSSLGPILFQCPRSLKASRAKLQELRKELASTVATPQRVVLEVRDESWFEDPGLAEELREAIWALCNHPNSVGRATIKQGAVKTERVPLAPLRNDCITADWVYVRLHGDNDEHSYDYSEEELEPYAAKVHEWRLQGLDVYVAFLNESGPPGCAMPKNARTFRRMVCTLAGETIPRAPKEPKKTMLSFFQPSAKKAKTAGE